MEDYGIALFRAAGGCTRPPQGQMEKDRGQGAQSRGSAPCTQGLLNIMFLDSLLTLAGGSQTVQTPPPG